MFTRIGNLMSSASALMVALIAWRGWRWAGSPPRPPALDSVALTVLVALAAGWLVCAIGLFFRSRMAWIGSVVGASAAVCACGVLLAGGAWVCLHPDTQVGGSPRPGGYVFAAVFMLAQFGLLF